MDLVYILKVHEPHESDEVVSIHKTFDGACKAWERKRNEIIRYYELCIDSINSEIISEISTAESNVEYIRDLERNINELKKMTPTMSVSSLLPQEPFIFPCEVLE